MDKSMKYIIITGLILYFGLFTLSAISPKFKEFISNPENWAEAMSSPLNRTNNIK